MFFTLGTFHSNKMRAKKIIVSGRVQGVGFRFYTQKKAIALGVNGTVQNQEDGSVLIFAEANEEALEEFLSWCENGPVTARVDDCQVVTVEPNGFLDFNINR